MSYLRLAYDDADTTPAMRADCGAIARRLRVLARRQAEVSAAGITAQAPSLRFEDFPGDVAKPEITVTEAAARLAAGMHLHLD